MVTKAELESDRQRSHALALRAIAAERERRHTQAVDLSLESMPYLDGAMQYEKRYLKIENPPVPTLEVIFRCAPPLFRFEALDRVEALVDEQKRVEKNSAVDVRAELAAARDRLERAGRLWSAIEAGRYDAEAAGCHLRDEGVIRNLWIEMGLIVVSHVDGRPVWALRTRLDDEVQARCFACGRRVQGKKLKFLEAGRCPRCQATTHFAILPPKQQG